MTSIISSNRLQAAVLVVSAANETSLRNVGLKLGELSALVDPVMVSLFTLEELAAFQGKFEDFSSVARVANQLAATSDRVDGPVMSLSSIIEFFAMREQARPLILYVIGPRGLTRGEREAIEDSLRKVNSLAFCLIYRSMSAEDGTGWKQLATDAAMGNFAEVFVPTDGYALSFILENWVDRLRTAGYNV